MHRVLPVQALLSGTVSHALRSNRFDMLQRSVSQRYPVTNGVVTSGVVTGGVRRAIFCLGLALLLTFTLALYPPPDASAVSTASASHPADTLSVDVEAGRPLITDLPSRYRGQPIRAYRIARAPALASVAGQSLLWITRSEDVGQHEIALLAQTSRAPADTVWVRVNVKAPK